MSRAYEALDEARLLAAADHWKTCVNRLYYACFYATRALLGAHDYYAKTHSGVHVLLNKHFVKPGLFPREQAALYSELMDQRLEVDYDDFVTLDPTTVRSWMKQSRQFVQTVDSILRDEGT
ncbi:MAG: HEPN domain-containing protein [Bacteroidetes bacterium]|jgi:uncharacterized protein (UPF0332 family)|nr:HEPN domain-containing protein [Bacteroidota bacterium]